MAEFAVANSHRDDPLAVLLERPEAVFCALADDGFRVPFPASLAVAAHRQLPVPVDRATMLDLVAPQDGLTVVTAWEAVRTAGVAHATVHLRHDSQRPLTLTFVDARHTHGVWIGAFTDHQTAEARTSNRVLTGSLTIPLRPRTATIQKSSLGVITGIDDRATRMLGWTETDMIGIRSTEFLHPDDQDRAVVSWLEMLAKKESIRVRLRHRTVGGDWLWVECENIYYPAEDPDEVRVATQLSDISDEMAIHDALDRRERLLRRVAESVPVGLLQIASDTSLVYANSRISTMLGISKVESWDEVMATVAEADKVTLSAAMDEALAGGIGTELEVEIAQPLSGEARICGVSLRSLSDREGVPGALMCVTDVTDSVRMRKALTLKATFDMLTGCYNRASTIAMIDEALARPDKPLTAVIFIDLDQFKSVNDRYGHAVGDELLIEAAARLSGVVRSGDTVGRIGGDEFLLVSCGLPSAEAAMSLAQRVRDALHRPVAASPGMIDMCASIGVACSAAGIDSTILIHNADVAMYESKKEHQGRPVLYSSL